MCVCQALGRGFFYCVQKLLCVFAPLVVFTNLWIYEHALYVVLAASILLSLFMEVKVAFAVLADDSFRLLGVGCLW